MYGMNNSGKLFADELSQLYEAGLNHYKWKMPVYYSYEPDDSKLVVSIYVDDCVYRYTYEGLGKICILIYVR